VTQGTRRNWTRWLLFGCALALLFAVPIIIALESRDPVRAVLAGGDTTTPAEGGPGSVRLAAPVPEADAQPIPRTGLARAAVAAAEAATAPDTELAVAVYDRTTGESAVGDRGSVPFYTASLAKVVLAVDLMERRRADELALSNGDLALLRRALGPSDDAAMNQLWTKFDGQGAAARVSDKLDLDGTSGPKDPSQWGEMSVSAVDFVRIWRYLLDEMPSADRDLLVSAMDAAPATAHDGFDQAFGLLSPSVRGPDGPGAVAKQGWMCCLSGQYYLHSSGAVGSDDRFLVILLTKEPRGPGWEAARQGMDDIATAAVEALH
jgi:hypothetical protein